MTRLTKGKSPKRASKPTMFGVSQLLREIDECPVEAHGRDSQLVPLLVALRAIKQGDFAIRLPEGIGIAGEVAQAFNELAAMSQWVANETVKVSRAIAQEGFLSERLALSGAGATWRIPTLNEHTKHMPIVAIKAIVMPDQSRNTVRPA